MQTFIFAVLGILANFVVLAGAILGGYVGFTINSESIVFMITGAFIGYFATAIPIEISIILAEEKYYLSP